MPAKTTLNIPGVVFDDALHRPGAELPPVRADLLSKVAEYFLAGTAGAAVHEAAAVGMGRDLRLVAPQISAAGPYAIVSTRVFREEVTRSSLMPGSSQANSGRRARDGRRLAVAGLMAAKGSFAIIVESIDERGRHETIVELPDSEVNVAGWTPDGKTIMGTGGSLGSRTPIFRFDEGQPMRTIAEEPGAISSMVVSPDGRWLAYDSTGSGSIEVYAMPATGKGARVAVTGRGGQSPRWSRDGRQLFFRRASTLMAVDVELAATEIHFGPERKLFEWNVGREYDVGPAGDFYGMEPVPGAARQTSIQLRTGWFDEVDRLMRRRP